MAVDKVEGQVRRGGLYSGKISRSIIPLVLLGSWLFPVECRLGHDLRVAAQEGLFRPGGSSAQFAFHLAPAAARAEARSLSSLQSYTGILDMPNARVMPDWSLRLNYGNADPYRYYGVAVGFWDRLEFHGQFTEVTTTRAFEGEGYGYYRTGRPGRVWC